MGLYDEVEIEDMDWNEDMQAFTYQCPCGDLFQITLVSFPRGYSPLCALKCVFNGRLEWSLFGILWALPLS